jgi:hypothetical protein
MRDKTDKLILHPTDMAQWRALVIEAQRLRAHELGEDLESYLVFLLMRYTTKHELASSVVAVDFLEGLTASGALAHDRLRDVGDKCLLFSGLFPGLAERRRVEVNYFVEMGQSAYGSISSSAMREVNELFQSLSLEFVSMVNVLQATRKISGEFDSYNETLSQLKMPPTNMH